MKTYAFLATALLLAGTRAHAKDVYAEVGQATAKKQHSTLIKVRGVSRVYKKLLSNARYYNVADYHVTLANGHCYRVTYCIGGQRELGFIVQDSETLCLDSN